MYTVDSYKGKSRPFLGIKKSTSAYKSIVVPEKNKVHKFIENLSIMRWKIVIFVYFKSCT